MGLWDSIKSGLGKAINFGTNAYGKYRDIKDTYKELVPKKMRRRLADTAGWAKGRAVGGIGNMIQGRRFNDEDEDNPRESLQEHLRNAKYDRRERKEEKRYRKQEKMYRKEQKRARYSGGSSYGGYY
jgi:hypothetical protein